MNIAPLTTRGHSSITGLSLSYRSLIDYISHQSLHPHSCSQLSRLHLISISQSPSPNHTHTHTHYISPGHSPIHCRVLLACLHTKRFLGFLLDFLCSDSLPVLLIYCLCLALWILFSDRRPTLALGLFLCLAHAIPVCSCPTLPVLTMFNNKALQMDPLVSRLVNPITIYIYIYIYI